MNVLGFNHIIILMSYNEIVIMLIKFDFGTFCAERYLIKVLDKTHILNYS